MEIPNLHKICMGRNYYNEFIVPFLVLFGISGHLITKFFGEGGAHGKDLENIR
jgi:hypothetical protein